MEIFKIKHGLLILGMSFLGYGCSSDKVEKYEDYITQLFNEKTELEEDLAETKEVLQITQEDVIKNKVIISQTLNELRELSAMTGIVRNDLEKGAAKLTQSEEISRHIKTIKERIETLESESGGAVVSSLKIIIEEKEREIESLRRTIRAQAGTISHQTNTIDRQRTALDEQSVDLLNKTVALEATTKRQVELLWEAGRNFENLGDDAPNVSGRRDNRRVDDWMRQCYEKAKYYYLKARDNGKDGVSTDLNRINAKLSRL